MSQDMLYELIKIKNRDRNKAQTSVDLNLTLITEIILVFGTIVSYQIYWFCILTLKNKQRLRDSQLKLANLAKHIRPKPASGSIWKTCSGSIHNHRLLLRCTARP